jgi:hypothetical protein
MNKIASIQILGLVVSFAACEAKAIAGTEQGRIPVARPTPARPLLIGNWADPGVLKDGDDY